MSTPPGPDVRLISFEERAQVVRPLTTYAFMPSPWKADAPEEWEKQNKYAADMRTFVSYSDGAALGTATVIPMTQNVRGVVVPMGGVASVATHPAARGRGHARALLTRSLTDMVEQGQPVSVLYPFRSSFYEKFGYAAMPKSPKARLSPRDLAPTLRMDVPGEVTLYRASEAFDELRAFQQALQPRIHGFSIHPESFAARLRDVDEDWIAVARSEGAVVATMLYTIKQHGGELVVDEFLTTGPIGRTLLLRWLAAHGDQIGTAVLSLPPSERPDMWLTDLDITTEMVRRVPDRNPPMGRVISLEGLAGMAVGTGEVTLTVVDELVPTCAGTYRLSSSDGRLEVKRLGPATDAPVTVTAPGLAALVYGVLDPDDLVLRGFVTAAPEGRAALRELLPPAVPYVFEDF